MNVKKYTGKREIMKRVITAVLFVGLSLFAVSSMAALIDGQTLKGVCSDYVDTINNNADALEMVISAGCTGYVAGVFDNEMATITKNHPNFSNCFNKIYPDITIKQLALFVSVYFDNNAEAVNKSGEYAVTETIKQDYPATECLKK